MTGRRYAALLLALPLVGSGALAAQAPEVGDDWYPIACKTWHAHLSTRIEELRSARILDEVDAAAFVTAAQRARHNCRMGDRRALLSFLSLGEALTSWAKPTEDPPNIAGVTER